MGQTGVGKSTLLNKIAPDLNLKQEKSQIVWVVVAILLELLVFTISMVVKSQIPQDFHR